MKSFLLHGLSPNQRFKGGLILIGIIALFIIFKFLNLVPHAIDELPLASETTQIRSEGNLGFGVGEGQDLTPELVPVSQFIDVGLYFLRDDLKFNYVTRFISYKLKDLIYIIDNILKGGSRGFGLSAPPWTAIVTFAFILGYALNGWRLSILSGGTLLYCAFFGLWQYTMETLALLTVAVSFSIVIGLLLGVVAYKKKTFEHFILPILNVMQTLPHFAYLIPVVVFFGIGLQTGVIATIIFAVPPMVRLTLLGLQTISPEITEAGKMSGCSKWQLLFRVQIPSARNEIILGINQVIMQCFAMVVIAALIGAQGLGYRLINKIQTIKIGQALEIGIAIVLLAVVLDSISRAWAQKKRDYTANLPFYLRYKYQILMIALIVLSYILSNYYPVLYKLPRGMTFTYYKVWDGGIDWMVVNWDSYIAPFRGFIIVEVMRPLKEALLFMPWLAVLIFVGGLGLILGGYYSAFVTVGFFVFVGLSGWWDRAMITAYMVLSATIISVGLGVPIGIWSAMNAARSRTALLWCDTLQTFPSFIYLLPAIMLFQVNDFSAMMSIIIYAIVPSIRYTVEGFNNISPELHEAATMTGCNTRQRLFQIQLPVAIPHIMLGINQTVMFAFSMVIIAAFIGTVDLGQMIFKALSETSIGRGLCLGLCVSFMALAVDHLITKWAKERKMLLGLE